MTATRAPGRDEDADAPPPAERVATALDRVWDRIVGAPAGVATVLLLALTVARSGFKLEWGDAIMWVRMGQAFPEPLSSWKANSVVGPALSHVLGIETQEGWLALHVVVLVAVVALLGGVVATRFATREARTIAAAWLALGSIAPAVTQKVGSYDVYVVAGVALVVWGGRRGTVVAGGILLGATSAEQGVVGLAAAGLVAAALADTAPDRPGLVARLRSTALVPHLATAGAALALTRLLVLSVHRSSGIVVPTRAEVFGTYLGDSLHNAASAGLAGVYSWLGLGWGLLALAAVALGWSRRTLLAVLAGLVAVPAAFTVTTLDGTRVFAMVSMAAYLVVLGRLADATGEGRVDRRFVHRATTAALLAAPLLPALLTAPSGDPHFVLPF